MTPPDWDGIERREALMLAEQLQPRRATVEAPMVVVLVGFAAVLLLQAASVWTHGTIIQRQRETADFRRQISCFIVHSAQGETGANVLTSCGFLNVGVIPK